MSASVASSQTSSGSTQTRSELVSLCERAKDEVIALRALTAKQKESIEAAESALDAERAARVLTQDELDIRLQEIAKLRQAYETSQQAYDLKQKEVDRLEKQLRSERTKKRFFKTMFKLSGAAALVLAGVVLIQ